MRRSVIFGTILLALVVMTTCASNGGEKYPMQDGIQVIPKPQHLVAHEGRFTVNEKTSMELIGDYHSIMPTAGFLADTIRNATGLSPAFSTEDKGKGKNLIRLTLAEDLSELGIEGYTLTVQPDHIDLKAHQPAGLFYAAQTLLQLMPPDVYQPSTTSKKIKIRIPCVEIKDRPRFGWRGLMLDVSRHFFPTEFVYRFIDFLAMHKLNTFHWHLVDDQGWRIEIKKYPKLTEVGAWRVDREDQHWNARDPQKPGEKATLGGFYTQDEIRDIVSYAANRHITIIPEIEMPGHTTAALAAYPEYSCSGGPFTVLPGGVWPITDIFCAGKEETFTFLEDILTEVMDLFPSRFIHIGGDEATKTEWEKCPLCQARIKKEGLKDEEELQSYFTRRIERFLNSKDRRLIGWDEILEGGLAPQATVMSWRGTEGGIDAARQGHDVVMSPTSHCYFDYYQGEPDHEPPAIGGYLPLSRVYEFEPVPAELSEQEATFILGAQANLWTEYISTPEHAEYMLFPRTAALAEAAWTDPKLRDWADFATRLEGQLARYRAAGIQYAKSAFDVRFSPAFDKDSGRLSVQLSTEIPQCDIHYTLDGKDPNRRSKLYTETLSIDRTAVLKAASFIRGERICPVRVKEFTLHEAVGKTVHVTFPYSERYSGGGDFALVNGLRGTKNQRDGLWQGYEGVDLEAVVDLGKSISIEHLSAGFLQNISSRIFLPTQVEFALSQDGISFNLAAVIPYDISPQAADRVIKQFEATIDPVQTQYIRIRAKSIGLCPEWHFAAGGKAWLFIDEILIH